MVEKIKAETRMKMKKRISKGYKSETESAEKRTRAEKHRGRINCFVMAAAILVLTATVGPAMTVSASGAGNIISGKLNVLYGIVSSILSGIGMLVTLWGIGEWGFSYQGNEGMMQAHAFKRICGGLIVALAPEVLPLLL